VASQITSAPPAGTVASACQCVTRPATSKGDTDVSFFPLRPQSNPCYASGGTSHHAHRPHPFRAPSHFENVE
jgi:hypothetical protein